MAGGRTHTPHPTPPVSAPGHKLQKPSKESGIFQSLGTLVLFVFTKRQRQKGGPWHNAPFACSAPALEPETRELVNG